MQENEKDVKSSE